MARILIIDDDILSLGIMRLLVEKLGHETVCLQDAAKARATVETGAFDLLMTDIMMPEVDGFAVVQAAKGVNPDIKVIVVSAIDERVPEHMTAVAYRRLGIDAVLSKPYNPGRIAATIREVLAEGP